jgi:hypothetical protein
VPDRRVLVSAKVRSASVIPTKVLLLPVVLPHPALRAEKSILRPILGFLTADVPKIELLFPVVRLNQTRCQRHVAFPSRRRISGCLSDIGIMCPVVLLLPVKAPQTC